MAVQLGGTEMRRLHKLILIASAAAVAAVYTSAAFAESAAERAVKEAQKYKGTTINIVWEAGLQSLDPLNFSGPKWEQLTGIHVNVVEVPILLQKAVEDCLER
jgi:multiple sugar transport system substrate-binding protein